MEEKLSSAAKNGNLEEVKRCVENDQVPVDCRFPTNDGPTALYWAACNGYPDICTYLLVQGAKPDMALPRTDSTPLHAACDRGHYDCALLLLTSGSKINRQTSNNGDTALHLASYRGHANVCQLLLSREADITLMNKQGRTPLDEAYLQEHSKVIEILSHLELECSFKVETSTQKKNRIFPVFEDRIGILHYYSGNNSKKIIEKHSTASNLHYGFYESSSFHSSFIHQPTTSTGKKAKKVLPKKDTFSTKHKTEKNFSLSAYADVNFDKLETDLQKDIHNKMRQSQRNKAKEFNITSTNSNLSGSSKHLENEKHNVGFLKKEKVKNSYIPKDLCEKFCSASKNPEEKGNPNSERIKELEDLVNSLNKILEEKEAIIENLIEKNEELKFKLKKTL